MPSIRLLDPHLINQISAGEVVERPASVLKELIENALDANPTHITVRWRHGGQSLLEVEDDGFGIPANQMRLALSRHATSKLYTQEDLRSIATFGFRGEALSSMAAVARLTLTSICATQEHAWSLSVHGGQEINFMPANRVKGTAVRVQDLFFATPARLKFMRSVALEQQYLWDTVYKILLAHPDISFSVYSDTRTVHYTVGIEKRLYDVFGSTFCEDSFYVDDTRSSYRLTGWIGLPTHHRALADRQFYCVNTRSIKDKILGAAFRAAFGDTMPKNRHPVGALFLTAPLADVDVNVHPAKTEVRFVDPRFVRGFIMGVLKDAVWKNGLRAASWCDSAGHSIQPVGADSRMAVASRALDSVAHSSVTPSVNPVSPLFDSEITGLNQQKQWHENTENFSAIQPNMSGANTGFDTNMHSVPNTGFTIEKNAGLGHKNRTFQKSIYNPTIAREDSYFTPSSFNASLDSSSLPVSPFGIASVSDSDTSMPSGSYPKHPVVSETTDSQALPKVFHLNASDTPIFVDLGQAFMQIQDSYIVAKSSAGLVLVDPHAAHERIVYEHMKRQWADDVGHIQNFLWPIAWSLTPNEYEIMENLQEKMKILGFEYTLSGNLYEKSSVDSPSSQCTMQNEQWLENQDRFREHSHASQEQNQGIAKELGRNRSQNLQCQLKTIPVIFQAYEPEQLVRDIITCAKESDCVQDIILKWRNHMMANWACRQSLKLGQHMTISAMNYLLRTLERTPHGAQCNHGRCVYRILGFKELSRMFDR